MDHAQAGYGYGVQQPVISPLGGQLAGNIGGLGSYGYQDISYSPPEVEASIPGMHYPVMPSGKPASGCKTCGGQSAWPSTAAINSAVAPHAVGYPGMAYSDERVPYGVSPYGAAPYGYAPQGVSPAGQFPGMNPGPYYGSPMGDIPVGASPLAEGLPGTVAGVANCEPYPYYGGVPSIPPIPSFPPMPPLGPLRGDGSGESGESIDSEDEVTKIAPVKNRQAKTKLKVAVARKSKPKRKESLPWIKW
ncbi:hypothetical protein [Cohnella cholangitidis]|uniref:Uncharacterized protein n=1 Tax=Cohnella cholangitidis TaxID=2598458 RepID=A0A7G5C3P1_9BACL|nr:hypothetical protein [Cohnella cholangitidis]QMV43825.1 hypothetical protein FPL14_23625 [Cohnella cholangitidis]